MSSPSLEVVVRPAKGKERTFRLPSFGMPRASVLTLGLDRTAVLAIGLAFVVSRALVFLVIWLSSAALPVRIGSGQLFASPNNMLLDGLIRFDSWWYRDIVVNGYRLGSIETGEQGTVAFFPLYPMTVKFVSQIVGNVYFAGVLVSNLCFLLALVFLFKLADREFGNAVAGRFVFYYAMAPTALFFSAMYTESMFIMLTAAVFYFAREGKWFRAAACGALVAATRNTGILVASVIAIEGLSQAGVRFWPGTIRPKTVIAHYKDQIRPAIGGWKAYVAAGLVPLGLIAYMAYLSKTFGDPLAFIHVQATWGRETSGAGLLQIVANTKKTLAWGDSPMMGQLNVVVLMDLIATLAFLPIVIMTAFKLRPAYAVYAALTFLVPLSTGSVGSMSRYILMLIPCFLLLAVWGKRVWVDRLVVGISLPLLAYFAVLFSHWYFAG